MRAEKASRELALVVPLRYITLSLKEHVATVASPSSGALIPPDNTVRGICHYRGIRTTAWVSLDAKTLE